MRSRTHRHATPWLLAAGLWAAVPHASGSTFETGESFAIDVGERHEGDLYLVSPTARVQGTQDGDLAMAGQSLTISGEVTGDLFYAGQSLAITGRVGDSVRVFANDLHVDGEIAGDLLVFAQNVDLGPDCEVHGDLVVYGAQVGVACGVNGSLEAIAGQIDINGTIDQNAKVRSDLIDIGPRASIGGDLSYRARNRLELTSQVAVAGEILYEELLDDDGDNDDAMVSAGGIARWLWMLTVSLLAGVLGIAMFRHPLAAIETTIAEDGLRSVAVGFVTMITVPFVAGLMILFFFLVVTVPVGLLLLAVWWALLYVGKLPVALWIGRRLLGRAGDEADPSPYIAMLAGLVLLYAGFALPVLGKLLWFLATWAGLGAIVLVAWSYSQRLQGPSVPTVSEGP